MKYNQHFWVGSIYNAPLIPLIISLRIPYLWIISRSLEKSVQILSLRFVRHSMMIISTSIFNRKLMKNNRRFDPWNLECLFPVGPLPESFSTNIKFPMSSPILKLFPETRALSSSSLPGTQTDLVWFFPPWMLALDPGGGNWRRGNRSTTTSAVYILSNYPGLIVIYRSIGHHSPPLSFWFS